MFRARDAIAAFIAPWVEARTLDRAAFDEHGVAWGPYQTFRQLAAEDWRWSTEKADCTPNGGPAPSTSTTACSTGETLPLTWIWTYVTPTAPTAALRSDGHPATAEGGPLAGLERRMFIGGSLEAGADSASRNSPGGRVQCLAVVADGLADPDLTGSKSD